MPFGSGVLNPSTYVSPVLHFADPEQIPVSDKTLIASHFMLKFAKTINPPVGRNARPRVTIISEISWYPCQTPLRSSKKSPDSTYGGNHNFLDSTWHGTSQLNCLEAKLSVRISSRSRLTS